MIVAHEKIFDELHAWQLWPKSAHQFQTFGLQGIHSAKRPSRFTRIEEGARC